MVRLSIVIASKNEEHNIRKCLESIKWASEIVVVDDLSTDKTVEICKEYTEKIFINDSADGFHKNKNLAIEKATGNWILSLDADEVVTSELKEDILAAVNINPSAVSGYYILRKNFFLGRWIKGCGWHPDYAIRLFRKGSAIWPLEIHATPEIEDKKAVGCLNSFLLHYSYRSFQQYFEKFDRYTGLIAEEEYKKGTRINKCNFFVLFLMKPSYIMLRKYFFQKGFMDGFSGFFISFSGALVIFVSYAKVWEKQVCCLGE